MTNKSIAFNSHSLQVHPGDKVHMEVYAKYIHPDDQADPELLAIQQVMAAIAGATSPMMIEGTAYGTTQNALPFDLDSGAPGDENDDYSGPQAYLNYVFLPLDFDLTRMGLRAVKMTDVARETGTNVPHELLELEFTATEPGYLYVFVSNDREEVVEEVFFDDLKVVHEKGPIVQVDDYYPFGLAFNSYSSGVKNDFLYNGKELQDELDLGWYDYQARQYDPVVGRFLSVDPMADIMRRHSTYSYVFNNPLRYIDPDGMVPSQYRTLEDANNGTVTGNTETVGGAPSGGDGTKQQEPESDFTPLDEILPDDWHAQLIKKGASEIWKGVSSLFAEGEVAASKKGDMYTDIKGEQDPNDYHSESTDVDKSDSPGFSMMVSKAGDMLSSVANGTADILDKVNDALEHFKVT